PAAYEGADFPMYLISPDDMPKVALDVEESVHHAIGQEAVFDWEHYVDAHGWFKAGPNHHGFVPTMYHDLHCMRMLHRALFPALAVEETTGDHAQHCLNYIRQTVLCYPDLTLEPPDVMSRNWTVDRAGGSTHVCYDWSLALRRGDELHSDWINFIGHRWEKNSR
ncbi:hypothetical protein EXIGLDRAFT_622900, partial [Exidia glandulosa HHB12029]